MAFAGMIGKAEESLPGASGSPAMSSFTTFNLSGLEIMNSLVLPLVVIFTVTNAIVPGIADGGSWYKVFSNLTITAVMSGACLIFLPPMAGMLFQSVQM